MNEVRLYVISILAVGLLALAIWVTHSHFEASAFNAATGKDVSTWQAMWIQLRVQESAE